MTKVRKKKKRNIMKMVGLVCFIILVAVYSYLLIQSKFQLEANASPPIEEHVTIDDQLDVSKPTNSKEVEKEIPDKVTPDRQEEPNKTENTPAKDAPIKTTPAKDTPVKTTPVDETKPESPSTDGEPPQASSKTVYLTFDDGPHKVSSDILSLLAKYNAKATFFMLDGNIKKYPDAVKQMVGQGHSVGMHGVTHDKNKFYQSKDSVLNEMDLTRQTILEITGVDSTLIRTPFGSSPHMKDSYKEAVTDAGYKMWDWNIDSRDWDYRDEQYVTSVIDQLNKMQSSQKPIVILLHERPETLEHLPKLLDYLKTENYTFEAINPSMDPIQLP